MTDDTHHADAGGVLPLEVVADLVDHIVGRVQRQHLRPGVFFNGHLSRHIGAEDRQRARLRHQLLERRQCGGDQAVFQVLHHRLHLRVAGPSLMNRTDEPGNDRAIPESHLYPLLGKKKV